MSDEADLARTVEILVDVEEIKKLKARYFRFVDLHWWEELSELFTEDLVIDIEGSPSAPRTREEFIAAGKDHVSMMMTVHHGHMPEIDIIDESNARGIWSMFDLIEPGAGLGLPVLTGFGHYAEEYRKVDGRWRIARMRLTRLRQSIDGVIVEGSIVSGRRRFTE